MQVRDYLPDPLRSLLDVGCNVGAWLKDCARDFPSCRLAGIEINEPAMKQAQLQVPSAEIHHTGAENIPFPDPSFQVVTCLEVLEHLPEELRATAFREMHRVLEPGGRLIMTVPHAGWFAWLDSNNVRLRFPALYRRIVGQGKRDANYDAIGRHVEWHYHFTLKELDQLAGAGWKRTVVRRGGLFVYPIMDWLSWPFYRLGKANHPIRRFFQRVAGWDYRIDFGRASYGILVVWERE
jgi:SAM-dependent methyltransferase